MTTIENLILMLILCCPRHELNRDAELRAEVAGYFDAAGEVYDVDPSLLVYWAYRESSLKSNAVGKIPNKFGVVLNEIGYMQIHGRARKLCEEAGYNVFDPRDNIFCGAMLIDESRLFCGSLEKGLVRYASGSCSNEKASKKIKRRLKKWKKMTR